MRYKSLTPFMKKSCVWSLHQSSASFLKGFFLGVLKVQSYIHAHQFLVLHKNVYEGGTLGFSFCTHLLHRSITAHKKQHYVWVTPIHWTSFFLRPELSVKSSCLHPVFGPAFTPYPLLQWYLQSKGILLNLSI
jgi:hypothetical protein